MQTNQHFLNSKRLQENVKWGPLTDEGFFPVKFYEVPFLCVLYRTLAADAAAMFVSCDIL